MLYTYRYTFFIGPLFFIIQKKRKKQKMVSISKPEISGPHFWSGRGKGVIAEVKQWQAIPLHQLPIQTGKLGQ